ncbi:hypothetical protein DPMN_047767 [Dreissena polymorpha]|uniref:GIY-YIG domain-containing protein n=1 Tax=Dreissena polymorpha TaxID=45954 RepID=A0A9D4DAC2_DREPO|nr:hypothetical protein DPMN_047767 [Dreissena polymorpha]
MREHTEGTETSTSKATFITHICETNCTYCNKLTTNDIQDTDGKITNSTCKNVTCRTRNVIYGIGCNKCECVVYVGETERQIRERMSEHLRDVRLHKEKPITTHFDSSHCDDNMYFSVLETLNIAGRQERVRQGFPLSSSLFIICIEYLSHYIQPNKHIKGKSLEPDEEIKQSRFATYFLNDSSDSFDNLIESPTLFGMASGLKLNKSKCTVLRCHWRALAERGSTD